MERSPSSALNYVWLLHRVVFRYQPSVKADDVYLLFREPGVLSGYRLPGKPWLYYLQSIFQLHNETINIWTHLVATFLILHKIHSYSAEFDFLNDPESWPILGFGICCVLYSALSTIAHAVHSKSAFFHYTCYQADYAGIGFYTLGTGILMFYLSAQKDWARRVESVFMPLNLILSWFGFVCCCIAKLRYRRPYPFQRKLWNLVSFGLHVFLIAMLVFLRVFDCENEVACKSSAIDNHFIVLLLLITSTFFFSSHIPERFWPGKFDIFGQGHQIFHVLATVQTLKQFDAAYKDIKLRGLHNAPIPDIFSILLAIVLFGFIALVTIRLLKPYVLKRIKEDMYYQRHY